ncbi:hypothetical protein Tco_1300867 [Tanacetum coccineum]
MTYSIHITPISLSPPSAGERLARCTTPHAHSPPLPPTSGCLTQIQTLRIASTQALINAGLPEVEGLIIGFVITVDAEDGDRGLECWVRDYGILGTCKLYWRMPRIESRISQRADRDSQRDTPDHSTVQSTLIQTQHQVHETRFHMQQTELATLRETDRRRQDQMIETLRVIRDMRREMSDMQAELLALREQRRTAGQSGPEARIPDHQEASGDADSHI